MAGHHTRSEEEGRTVRLTPLSCALLAALTVGCKSETAPPSGTSSAPAISTAASNQPPAAPSAYKDEDLPVPPDFEAAAAKAITADNYKQKLAEIVAEITGAEGGPAASASASASASAKPSAK